MLRITLINGLVLINAYTGINQRLRNFLMYHLFLNDLNVSNLEIIWLKYLEVIRSCLQHPNCECARRGAESRSEYNHLATFPVTKQ